MNFAIGITTFESRLQRLQNLLFSIRNKTNCPIILAVNGEYDTPLNEEYRRKILLLASSIPNCLISIFPEFRSLAKLWNTILITSTHDWNLILNDDVVIDSSFSFELYEKISLLNNVDECFALNGSWSHYFVNRKLIEKIGWFDEKLLGIGEEDSDMFWRLENAGKKIHKPTINGIYNIHDGSIPKGIKTGVMHYTFYNRDYIHNKKYQDTSAGVEGMFQRPVSQVIPTINSYPNEKFYWDNKNLLKQ